jgi:undecaprenyl-diphosphatase
MLTCVIMGSAFVMIGEYIKNRGLAFALKGLAVAVATVTVVGRLLSGVHWFTDILGGALISLALVTLFAAVCEKLDSKKE